MKEMTGTIDTPSFTDVDHCCVSEHARWMRMIRKRVRDLKWCCVLLLIKSVVKSESSIVITLNTLNQRWPLLRKGKVCCNS